MSYVRLTFGVEWWEEIWGLQWQGGRRCFPWWSWQIFRFSMKILRSRPVSQTGTSSSLHSFQRRWNSLLVVHFFFPFFFSINYTKIRGTPGAIGHHAIRDRFLQRDTRREKTVICLWKSVRIENEEFCNLSGRFVDVCEFNTVRIHIYVYIYISVIVSIVLR